MGEKEREIPSIMLLLGGFFIFWILAFQFLSSANFKFKADVMSEWLSGYHYQVVILRKILSFDCG